jgi:hypothetical protein
MNEDITITYHRNQFLRDTVRQLNNGYECYVYSKQALEEILPYLKVEVDCVEVDDYYVVKAKNKKRKNIY